MTDILEKIGDLEITERTKQNMVRKSDFVDDVQLVGDDGIPLFSWIDISLTDLCNRVCAFCPRADEDVYPNQNLHMSVSLIEKMSTELKELDYKGGIAFCGFGEPLLHPNIVKIIEIFGIEVRTEIVTNGDKLKIPLIHKLFDAGLSFLCISMYDGPHQVKHFQDMMEEAGIDQTRYILRDRWHNEEDSFGLKLTNRAGVMEFGPSVEKIEDKRCFYPAYSITLDWNGDALLCVQDWNKKVKLGNAHGSSLLNIWRQLRVHKIRTKLMNGNRCDAPCNGCNADGTLHGFNHVNAWSRIERVK